jgi:hypothetical protein
LAGWFDYPKRPTPASRDILGWNCENESHEAAVESSETEFVRIVQTAQAWLGRQESPSELRSAVKHAQELREQGLSG